MTLLCRDVSINLRRRSCRRMKDVFCRGSSIETINASRSCSLSFLCEVADVRACLESSWAVLKTHRWRPFPMHTFNERLSRWNLWISLFYPRTRSNTTPPLRKSPPRQMTRCLFSAAKRGIGGEGRQNATIRRSLKRFWVDIDCEFRPNETNQMSTVCLNCGRDLDSGFCAMTCK